MTTLGLKFLINFGVNSIFSKKSIQYSSLVNNDNCELKLTFKNCELKLIFNDFAIVFNKFSNF